MTAIAELTATGAEVFVCSDVLALSQEMTHTILQHPQGEDTSEPVFSQQLHNCDAEGWLLYRYLARPSEREVVCEMVGRKVFGALFKRN